MLRGWVTEKELLKHRYIQTHLCTRNTKNDHTISFRPPLRSSPGSTPASGQVPGDIADGTAAEGGKKTIRLGVPVAKIDGRLTDRFVVVSNIVLLEKVLRLHRCIRLEQAPFSGVEQEK